MATPNGRGGWDLSDEDVAVVMQASFGDSGLFTVKVCVETDIGELLAVREFEVRDDLLSAAGDATADQDAFQQNVQEAAAAAYREAAGK